MKVRDDIKDFLNSLPKDVSLVAATKYIDGEMMNHLFQNGVNNFGENRVDSFLVKYNQLSNLQIIWHFIGHLQTNKAKKIIDKIDYLHSLDSLKLAKIISENRKSPLKCFVEVSINNEASKNGVSPDETLELIKNLQVLDNIEIVGLMMMSVKSSTSNELKEQFSKLSKLRDKIEDELQIKIPYLSMGMSDDYLEAIECGATHIRLGKILYKQ